MAGAGRTVEVAGAPVHLLEAGAGPAVLALHGSGPGTTAAAWGATLGALAGRLRLVAPDLGGFGATPPPGGRATWTEQALGVMDALGVERFAVLGHSMGGAVALAVAAARPDAVPAVAAIGSLGAPMALPDGLDRLWAARPTEADAAAVQRLIGPDGRGPADRDAVAARLAAMRAQGGDAYAALFPPPRERHLDDLTLGRDELAAVRARVLLVHGGRDRIVPLLYALPLLDALPDADLHVLGRCGHSPHAEQPDTVHRLLADHLEHDA